MQEEYTTFSKENFNKQLYDNLLKKASLYTDVAFLIAHFAYLIFFLVETLYLMIIVNIVCIVFYAGLFFALRRKKYNFFFYVTAVEMLTYVTLSTMICGFDSFFHIWLVGLCILSFFAGYFSKKGSNKIKPMPFAILSIVAYAFLYIWCEVIEMEPYYHGTEAWTKSMNATAFMVHMVTIFIFLIAFTSTFTNYAITLEKRILRDSQTDKLTNIGNRKALEGYFDELDKKNKKYILAITDIDDFKKVNDRYGHLCGDYILKRVAEIAGAMSKYGKVFRYGGEEFVIIMEVKTSYDDAVMQIDKMRKAIADTEFTYDVFKIGTTITIGISTFEEGKTIDELILVADNRLYKGKQNGKNQVVSD